MTNSFSFTQKVANFGFDPPQDHDQTIPKKIANNQRRGTHFFNMGFDGNGFKTNCSKQEKSGENEPKQGPLESENEKGTFWTVCPYCYLMYEYEKKYEECCLRCQNCRKAFHGMAVPAPPERLLVNGKGGECYYGYGVFPLGYSGNSFSSDKKEFGGKDTKEKHVVVEISDDSDDDTKEMDVKNEAGKVKAEGFSNGEEGRIAMKKSVTLKSVPRNTKKMMGRGVKVTIEKVGVVEMNEDFWNEFADIVCENSEGIKLASNQNAGCNDDELGFYKGDDDIFVDLRDIL